MDTQLPILNSNSHTASSFWQWFAANEQRYRMLQQYDDEEAHDRLHEVVEELRKFSPSLKALMGKYDDHSDELIITSDGEVAYFVKVEELVAEAPNLPGWVITGHKPALGFDNICIEMYGKTFDHETVKFYPAIDEDHPDMVAVIFTHDEYNEDDDEDFQNAGSIYVQNGLGELNAATRLDYFEFGAEPEDKSELIPVTKLADYLLWREKEFVEKYNDTSITYPEEVYTTIEGEDDEGNVMMAIAVTSFEEWDYKPVFPWLVTIDLEYTGTLNGLPDEITLTRLHDIEEYIVAILTKEKECVYVASKTFKGCRSIFLYARDYRLPSTLLNKHADTATQPGINLSFFIEKDKYWQQASEFYELDDAVIAEDEQDEDEED